MSKIKFIITLCFLFFLFIGETAADVHIIVESKFIYRSMEQKTILEYWVTENKIYRKYRDRVQITREDLGLTWNIDVNRKSYMEKKIGYPGKPPSTENLDIHTLEFDYEPGYDWTVQKTGETKVINGFPCRCLLAEGESDFSEIRATYWMCTDVNVPGAEQFHRITLKRGESEKSRGGLLEILKTHKNSFPVFMEEVHEEPIAPSMRFQTTLVTLEETAAPPGIYDIPEGFKNTAPDKTGEGGEG